MKKLALTLALAFGTLAPAATWACDCQHTKDQKTACACADSGCSCATAMPDSKKQDKPKTPDGKKKPAAG